MACLLVPWMAAAAESTPATTVKAYAFHAGILKTQTHFLLKDTRVGTPMEIPVVYLVIQHGKDWVLFDTGCNIEAARDPARHWGKDIARDYVPVIKPGEDLREAIKVLGLAPGDFKAVILSHGHVDHAGAIEEFAGTRVPVCFQKEELRAIRKVVDAGISGAAYCLGDFKRMNDLNVQETEGIFDVFGDHSVMTFPTPGHTPGHQSLYVKLSTGVEFIYTADAMYTFENLERMIPQGLASDLGRAMLNLRWFQLESMRGVKIVPSHDAAYWAKHDWAPKELVPEGGGAGARPRVDIVFSNISCRETFKYVG